MEAYKVLRKIGVGTYGSAYLVASAKDLAQQFVLKKVKIDEDDADERLAAETEVKVLAQLQHPLVLGYVDHFMYKGHLCIVTEYCESGDLYSLLRTCKTSPPEPQILDWLVQVVLAVQYVHANNILHRDLKTQNIFLTRDSTVKLGDFGISRPLNSSLDLACTLIGTPYYMSPEVMSNQPYDFKSDMWSLGCCLYEMMSLKHAFDASDMSSLVCKIMRGEHLPIPQQFSPDLRDLVKSLLSRLPAKRPSPDAILKLPWLKDHVARARDKIAWLEAHKAPSRRPPPAQNAPGSRRTSDNGIDQELQAAKARLASIQTQRDALAALKDARVARMSNAHAAAIQQAQHAGAGAMPRPPLPPGSIAAAAAAAQQPSQHSARGSPVPRLNAGDSLGNPGDRVTYLSRNSSCEGGAPSARANSAPLPLDPKARREAKREEEIRQREAELLAARRRYYEERKQAEVKNWHMIHGESHGTGSLRCSPAPDMPGSVASLAGDMQRAGISNSSMDDEERFMAQYHQQQQAVAMGRDSIAGDAAAEDFEAELQLLNQCTPSDDALLKTLAGHHRSGSEGSAHDMQQASAAQRAAALRNVCVSALGAPLLELVYQVMRQRIAQGGGDAVFRQELNTRLGPHRVRYLQLVDALIYYEDVASAHGL